MGAKNKVTQWTREKRAYHQQHHKQQEPGAGERWLPCLLVPWWDTMGPDCCSAHNGCTAAAEPRAKGSAASLVVSCKQTDPPPLGAGQAITKWSCRGPHVLGQQRFWIDYVTIETTLSQKRVRPAVQLSQQDCAGTRGRLPLPITHLSAQHIPGWIQFPYDYVTPLAIWIRHTDKGYK